MQKNLEELTVYDPGYIIPKYIQPQDFAPAMVKSI